MSLFTSIPKKWLILPAFILLVFPSSAFASIFTENFDSYSSGNFNAPQLNWRFQDNVSNPYVTPASTIVTSNAWSSPNSLKLSTGYGSNIWTVASTTGSTFTQVGLTGRIYMADAPVTQTCTSNTSPYISSSIGVPLAHGSFNIFFCVNGNVTFYYDYSGGSSYIVSPWGTGSASIWHTGWNTFYLRFVQNSAVGISINGSAMQYGPSYYTGNTSTGQVSVLSNASSYSHQQFDDLTLYTTGSTFPVGDVLFNGNTRIDTVIPSDGDNVSTTTPLDLYALGYLNPIITGDLVSTSTFLENAIANGIQIKWNVYSNVQTNNCIDVLCTLGGAGGVAGINYYSGPVFDNDFNVTTTMSDNLATGYYTLTTSIIKPSSFFGLSSIFGIGFGEDILVATTTQFTAGIPSAGQTALNDIYNATKAGIAGLTATSSAVSLASCNLFTFDIGTCLAVLFLPSASDMQNTIQFAKDNILSRAPWGYATRMVAILTNNATTTVSTALPTWTVTFPSIQGVSGSPLAGTSIVFDMQDMLDQGSTTLNGITDPISGKSVREIVEPYILLFIAISALIIMFHDVMGMGHHSNKYADN